jgi:hypothetical protein
MEWKKGVISGIIAGIPDRLMDDMERMGIKIQLEVTEGNRNTKRGI